MIGIIISFAVVYGIGVGFDYLRTSQWRFDWPISVINWFKRDAE